MSVALRPQVLAALCLGAAAFASLGTAQIAQSGGRWVPTPRRSPLLGNPAATEQVVWQDVIALDPSTPWLRLVFSEAHLDAGSYLRITSLLDGDTQILRAQHLKEWQYSTAYFNGYALTLELVAGAQSAKNYVVVERAWAGDPPGLPPATPETICGATDDRAPSTDARCGRMLTAGLGSGCTGWIINAPTTGNDRCHLTAGHCLAGNLTVLQFNVPASNTNCSLVHPTASNQFAVNTSTWVFANGGVGNDYGVFRCFANSNTGLTTFQTQGAAFVLATAMPAPGTTVRLTGYGTDGTSTNSASGGNTSCTSCSSPNGARNQVQQTHTGPYASSSGTTANHQVDTCGGNSGSPLILESTGAAVAIHTHGGCVNPTGSSANAGTQVTAPAVVNAINTVCGATGTLPNDECSGAIALSVGLNPSASNVGATTSGRAWPCGSGGNDLWYSFTASCNGTLTVDTCTGTNFDTTLELIDGVCGRLSTIVCNDDSCGTRSSVSAPITFGTTYLLRIGGFQGATGNFQLDVTESCTGPVNDECGGALVIQDGLNGPFVNSTATNSLPPWLCGSASKDLWFRYTASCTGTAIFETCADTAFDSVLQVFSGTCGSLSSLGCNDDACSLQSSLSVPVTSGVDYLVRVGGFGGASGSFRISVVGCIPLNDECHRAVSLNAGTNGPFSTIGATTSSAWPCATGGRDLWFSHVATCSGTLTVQTCTAARNFDTALEIFSGTCGALTSLQCNDDACGLGSSVAVPATLGTTYFLRLGGFNGSTGNAELVLTYTGTGGGLHATRATGCGAATLTASGNPTLSSTVSYTMGSLAGSAQLLWIGSAVSFPLCPPTPCTIGADFGIVIPTSSFSSAIPCDPTLLGGSLSVQGADLLAPGGCPSGNPFQLTLTPTIDTLIG